MSVKFQPVRLKIVERTWERKEVKPVLPPINLQALALMWPVVFYAGWVLFVSRLGSRLIWR